MYYEKNYRNSGEISPEYDLWVGERGSNKTFWGKNILKCHEFCPSCDDFYSMKCLIHVYLINVGS